MFHPFWILPVLPETTLIFMGATASITFITLERKQRQICCECRSLGSSFWGVLVVAFCYLCFDAAGMSWHGHFKEETQRATPAITARYIKNAITATTSEICRPLEIIRTKICSLLCVESFTCRKCPKLYSCTRTIIGIVIWLLKSQKQKTIVTIAWQGDLN